MNSECNKGRTYIKDCVSKITGYEVTQDRIASQCFKPKQKESCTKLNRELVMLMKSSFQVKSWTWDLKLSGSGVPV